ncbi:hypothetical protein [Vibrio caribbeanicus]|uniref:hypothetical protein n=1 Tax=Vibrio caribbeanicus TaxID=701175 RepID=UPI00228397A9|nr:hypothetical protein [Vibrio caribbeanicus]MCY9844444.1 hypothetical protein [Vibrio caribbeanicus]
MTDIVTSKTALTMGKSIFTTLQGAYQARQKERVESFFRCIELRYEFMTEAERLELNKTIDSEEGKHILASYIDAITQTSCDRVRMAVAVLYCQDSDFSFTQTEQRAFISGVAGITDNLVDFLLVAAKQEKTAGHYPYSRHIIQKCQINQLEIENLDGETVYACINDLVRRGLLLPEPAVGIFADENNWFIGYGTSQRIQKMVLLLKKAGELLRV